MMVSMMSGGICWLLFHSLQLVSLMYFPTDWLRNVRDFENAMVDFGDNVP